MEDAVQACSIDPESVDLRLEDYLKANIIKSNKSQTSLKQDEMYCHPIQVSTPEATGKQGEEKNTGEQS